MKDHCHDHHLTAVVVAEENHLVDHGWRMAAAAGVAAGGGEPDPGQVDAAGGGGKDAVDAGVHHPHHQEGVLQPLPSQ